MLLASTPFGNRMLPIADCWVPQNSVLTLSFAYLSAALEGCLLALITFSTPAALWILQLRLVVSCGQAFFFPLQKPLHWELGARLLQACNIWQREVIFHASSLIQDASPSLDEVGRGGEGWNCFDLCTTQFHAPSPDTVQ